MWKKKYPFDFNPKRGKRKASYVLEMKPKQGGTWEETSGIGVMIPDRKVLEKVKKDLEQKAPFFVYRIRKVAI